MTETEMAGALRESLWVVIKLAGPLLLTALVVGLAVSLFQAVTQVNEATLAFVPKLLALFACFALLGPFMVATLQAYTNDLMGRLISVGGS